MTGKRDKALDFYNLDQIRALLAKAEALGLPLDAGSPLEQMTIAQLEELVNGKTES